MEIDKYKREFAEKLMTHQIMSSPIYTAGYNIIDKMNDDFNSMTCNNCSYFRDNFRTCNLLGDLIESPSAMKCNSHERRRK